MTCAAADRPALRRGNEGASGIRPGVADRGCPAIVKDHIDENGDSVLFASHPIIAACVTTRTKPFSIVRGGHENLHGYG